MLYDQLIFYSVPYKFYLFVSRTKVKMENLFVDADFEPGMCFLVDTFDYCMENKIYGWMKKENGEFSVHFIFLGLKRKAFGDICSVSKKVRKLNASIENLLLNDGEDDETFEAVHPESTKEKQHTRSFSKIQFGAKLNLAASSRESLNVAVGFCESGISAVRKRKMIEHFGMEIGDQNETCKQKK